MKRIVYVLLVCSVFMILGSCKQEAEEDDASGCFLPRKYYIWCDDEIINKPIKLSDLTSIPVLYGFYIDKKDWGSSNYTAKLIFESEGVYIAQSEIVVDDFIGRYNQTNETIYIPFTMDNICKNVSSIRMKIQRTNDDGTVSDIFVSDMYYAIIGDEVYIDDELFEVQDFMADKCKIYNNGIDAETGICESIWFDEHDNILYVVKNYWGKGVNDDIEQYNYEKTAEGNYIVRDDEGIECFVIEQIDEKTIHIYGKEYKIED